MLKLNLKRFSLSILVRIVWYTAIAGVAVFYFKQDIVTHPHINLTLQTARPEVIQVFCNTGNGYSEALSSFVKTSTAQQNGEPFNLQLASACKSIRLDLGEAGALVKINSGNLVSSGGDNINILSSILSPSALNDIKISESNRGEFIATGNDPYVVLGGAFSTLTTSGYSLLAIFKMLGIFMFVFCLVVASDYWVNKED